MSDSPVYKNGSVMLIFSFIVPLLEVFEGIPSGTNLKVEFGVLSWVLLLRNTAAFGD